MKCNQTNQFSINISSMFKWCMMICVFLMTLLLFHPTLSVTIVIVVCLTVMVLLKVNYAIGSIVTLYFLVPNDFTSYMLYRTPLGNIPYYIILILIFILLGTLSKKINLMSVAKHEFYVYFALVLLIVLQITCYLYFNENVIISNLVKFAFQTIGMLMLVKTQAFQKKDIERVLVYILFLVTVSVFVAVTEILFGFNIYYTIYGKLDFSEQYTWAMSNSLAWRAKSTFGNPLVFGSTLVMCLPIVEYLRYMFKNDAFTAISLTVIAIGMAMSGSRSSIIILCLYLIYYVFTSKNINRKFAVIIGFLIIGFLLYINIDFSLIVNRFSILSGSNSITHRLESYKLFLDILLQYPFIGVGLGNTYQILAQYVSMNNGFVTNTFDNGFMDLSLAIGLVGWVALIVSIVNIVRLLKKKKISLSKYALILLCILSFFLNTTKYQSIWGLFMIYVSMNLYYVENDVKHKGVKHEAEECKEKLHV